MSLYLRHWRLLPIAMIFYGCASMSSPVSHLPATESTINEKIDQLVGQLTQETSIFTDKMFAVAELTDASDKKTALTAYLTDLLIDRLSRSGKIHLVERSRLDTVMNELDFSMTGYIEERSEKWLGRLIGADGIATGKVIDLGDTLDVKVRLIQTETGKIIATAQVELINDRKMQRLSGQAYEKPKTDIFDKIQELDQSKQVIDPGLIAILNKQYDKAVTIYQEALRIEPKAVDAWERLGASYDKLKQYDKALTAYQEAVRIKPDYPYAWYNLGVAYIDLKQYDKAVTAYQEAVRIKPDHADAWNNLGAVYFDLGRYGKTYKAYQTLRKLDASMADEFSDAVFKERWLQYSASDNGSVYFIDYKSITPVTETIIRVIAKIDINKNDKDFLKMREALREKGSLENAMDYVEINCVESKIRFLSTAWYGKEGMLHQNDYDDPTWEIILPDSIREHLKNAMCD